MKDRMSEGSTSWRIIEGDCIEAMAAMDKHSVDAVVCDPPYGLGFMGKDWDSPGGTGDFPMRRTTEANTVNTGASRQGGRQRASEDWHKRQLRDARSYQAWCEAWGAEALRLLRPGGYLLAMGGTRTYHRLASGLEDAGFEVRDMVEWLYGSGFPKHDSCLKPAHEPCMVGRKASRYSKPLNVDGCRIEASGRPAREVAPLRDDVEYHPTSLAGRVDGTLGSSKAVGTTDTGRWPANVVLDPEAAAMLDEQTGTLASNSGEPFTRNTDKHRNTYGAFAGRRAEAGYYGDSGGASRFFYVAKADTAERNIGLHGERNLHPTVKPVALMRWLIRLVTPKGGTVLDPFTGSGTTAMAALREGFSFVGVEREAEYVAVARARIIGDAPLLNSVAEAA
jgi:DNA modification methylase